MWIQSLSFPSKSILSWSDFGFGKPPTSKYQDPRWSIGTWRAYSLVAICVGNHCFNHMFPEKIEIEQLTGEDKRVYAVKSGSSRLQVVIAVLEELEERMGSAM